MSAVISLSEARLHAASAPPPAPHSAVDGVVRARFGSGAGHLHDLYQRQPLRLMRPHAEPGEPPTSILVNISGGIVGGDRHRVEIDCAGAALITGQAAEKVYRSEGPCAQVDVTLRARGCAALEWLPQGTILFDSARLRRRTVVRRDTGARVLTGEILILGRLGMGERTRSGFLLDRWHIEEEETPVWIDALRLDGDIGRAASSPAGFAGANALATVIYAADDAPALRDQARALLPETTGALRAGVTLLGKVLICRWLAAEPHRARAALGAFWCSFRAHALGRPARLPSLWRR